MFPQYILTKIKYILNNVYIIPLTKKQKFDQLFIVKNYWGGVTTPQAPPSRHAPADSSSLSIKIFQELRLIWIICHKILEISFNALLNDTIKNFVAIVLKAGVMPESGFEWMWGKSSADNFYKRLTYSGQPSNYPYYVLLPIIMHNI